VRITISKENYLKAIAEAESEGETVIAATLARWLKVSSPAVAMAIKRLKRDELIRVAASGAISLTRAGREIANRLMHRHNLIERMLTEVGFTLVSADYHAPLHGTYLLQKPRPGGQR